MESRPQRVAVCVGESLLLDGISFQLTGSLVLGEVEGVGGFVLPAGERC
jgi:hypothetical protein